MGTPYGGHYEAFIWDNMYEKPWEPKEYTAEVPQIFEGDEDLFLNWFEMNDTNVTAVNGLCLQNLFGDGKSNKNAYILYYE